MTNGRDRVDRVRTAALSPATATLAVSVLACVSLAGACGGSVELAASGSGSGSGSDASSSTGGGSSASATSGAAVTSGAGGAGAGGASSGATGGAGGEGPKACASDAAGRPFAVQAGGAGYTFAPGERIDLGNVDLHHVAIGDVTGDGLADVVGGDLDEAWIFRQTQEGALGVPIVLAHTFGNPPQLALVHADADATFDLVVSGWMGMEVILSLGGGFFAPAAFIPIDGVFPVHAGDVNLDGHDDVVGYAESGYVLLPGGGGSFGGPEPLPSPGQSNYLSLLSDVTGDQRLDLLAVDYAAKSLVIVPHDGMSGLSASGWTTLSLPGGLIDGLGVGDVNGDGRRDVVTQDDTFSYDTRTRLFLGAIGGFEAPVEIAQAKYSGTLVVADANADGRDDVVLAHAGGFEIGLVLSTANGMGPHVAFKVPTAASVLSRALAVGDVDCDGCPDVVTANVGGLVVFRGQGCGD